MFLTFFFFILLPAISNGRLRVGHLTSTVEERIVLNKCINNESIEIISLPACDQFNGVENAAQLHYKYETDVFTGAVCDEESQTVSRLAFRWNKIYISPSRLSTVEKEKTTISIQYNSNMGVAAGIVALVRDLNWTQVGVLYSAEFLHLSQVVKAEIYNQTSSNVTVSVAIGEYHWHEQLEDNTRIVIVLCSLEQMKELLIYQLTNVIRPHEYTFLFIDSSRLSASTFFTELSSSIVQYDAATYKHNLKLLSNIFFFRTAHPNIKHMKNWTTHNGFEMSKSVENHLMLCDAMHILAAIDRKSKKTKLLWENIVTHVSQGFTGPIFISPDGTRQLFFEVFAWHDGSVVIAGKINPLSENCDSNNCIWHSFLSTYHTNNTLLQSPPVIPECGFKGENCSHRHLFIIAAIVIGILMVPLSIAFYFQMKERELSKMPWRVPHEMLNFTLERDHPGYRRISTASSAKESMTAEDDKRHAYVGNSKVFVHNFTQKRAINFTRDEMKRLNQLKYLTHTNINVFHGISFNQNSELLVLWTYCVRGSLEDVLFAGGQRFGRNFQSTFCKHILNGVQYIHQSAIKVHGALFLSNCLVDSYWVVKLTDFGINGIIKHKIEQKEIVSMTLIGTEAMPCEYLQWPPEYLNVFVKTKNRYSFEPTVSGDIYQIGMLIYQILFYRRPFKEKNKPMEELVSMICDESLPTPVRPYVPEASDFTLRMVSLIQQAWSPRPDLRPALFKLVDAVAREFGKDAKGTLIDQMIQMIDEYSANLEEIVAERTKEMEEVQERTENLLYKLLPRYFKDFLIKR